MPKSSHLSVRTSAERREQLEVMADHRGLDLSKMVNAVIDAALEARQRSCKLTHSAQTRCGECGLLIVNGNPLERL